MLLFCADAVFWPLFFSSRFCCFFTCFFSSIFCCFLLWFLGGEWSSAASRGDAAVVPAKGAALAEGGGKCSYCFIATSYITEHMTLMAPQATHVTFRASVFHTQTHHTCTLHTYALHIPGIYFRAIAKNGYTRSVGVKNGYTLESSQRYTPRATRSVSYTHLTLPTKA